MPYIKPELRDDLEPVRMVPGNVGELNYQVTRVVSNYLLRKGTSYQTINDIIGVLESAKLEFYRRIAAPYENDKIKENGDVYS